MSIGYIVLGPYRSGTSLTSRILSALGVNFGPSKELFVGTKFNPLGYYERNDINTANNNILRSAGFNLAYTGNPVTIFEKADPTDLRNLELSWLKNSKTWGIKDPRMCATLWAWVNFNIITKDSLNIIHVKRSLDAATMSGMKDPNIPKYCDGTQQGIYNMLSHYASLAEWHISTLKVPTFSIQFENLIKNPDQTVHDLASFINVSNPSLIKKAIKQVGKKEAMRKYYLHRYFVRAPKKLFRIITRIKP